MAQITVERTEVKSGSRHLDQTRGVSFPHLFFRNRVTVLDTNNLEHIEVIGDDLANGKVAVANICGVIGFVIDGSNKNAIDKVCEIKGRDKLTSPLIIGASDSVRRDLIDTSRLPKGLIAPSSGCYDLPHFFELPIIDLPEGIGMQREGIGRVGAIFWANYYSPVAALEDALLVRNPKGFVGGTSANKHGHGSVTTTAELFDVFGHRRGWIDHVLRDSRFESQKPFSGSHTILRHDEEGNVVADRGGSITLRSFQQVYPNLRIPEGWQDKPGAIDVDLAQLRATRTYLTLTTVQGVEMNPFTAEAATTRALLR